MKQLVKRQRRWASHDGFTILELLVVLLIIGLLAAVALPSYLSQTDKATDADAKRAARTAATALETYETDNRGRYTGATAAALVAREASLSEWVTAMTVVAAADSYTVTINSPNTPNRFWITRSADGAIELQCSDAGADGCPGDGTWDG